MGLTPREYNELIVFWYPKLKDAPFVQLYFAGKEYEDLAKLSVSPTPDSIMRVFIIFRRLDKPQKVLPQTLPVLERKGFTVLEWGGTEVP